MCENLEISALTGKNIKGNDDSTIIGHLLFCDHAPDFEGFSIRRKLRIWSHFLKKSLMENFIFGAVFNVTLMEILIINRDHRPLNKNKKSLPLKHF